MRFTRITGKARFYISNFFKGKISAMKTNIYAPNIVYIKFNDVMYHVPTIRKELGLYLDRWVGQNFDVVTPEVISDLKNQLLQKTWEDLFKAASITDLLTPIKIEPVANQRI